MLDVVCIIEVYVILLVLSIVFVVIIVCLQIEMCKRSHDACKKSVPRDHEVG